MKSDETCSPNPKSRGFGGNTVGGTNERIILLSKRKMRKLITRLAIHACLNFTRFLLFPSATQFYINITRLIIAFTIEDEDAL